MAPRNLTEQANRAGARGGKAKPSEGRVLVIGSVGLAFLVGVVVGMGAVRGGPVASVPAMTASAAQVDPATSGKYVLSPPNEHDLGAGVSDILARRPAVGTASSGPYLLSPPNERDPGERGHAADRPTYRLSPPNETDQGTDDPADPVLTAAAAQGGAPGTIVITGEGFTPGGRVYVALYAQPSIWPEENRLSADAPTV